MSPKNGDRIEDFKPNDNNLNTYWYWFYAGVVHPLSRQRKVCYPAVARYLDWKCLRLQNLWPSQLQSAEK